MDVNVRLWQSCARKCGKLESRGRVVTGAQKGKKDQMVMASKDDKSVAGGISIHAVDISRGIPAAGLDVRLWRIDGNPREIATGTCAGNGLFQHTLAEGAGVERGMYEVKFDVGSYFRNSGVTVPDPSFLEVAVFRFGIDNVTEHFHLPFKFTPWGFSLFRGGA
jgi:5-hydroxyisourate hydrolase